MTVWGIVVAAGSGQRFGQPKHQVMLDGAALWERARDDLIQGGASDVVVVGNVEGGVSGGERRQDSVAAGLDRVPADVEFVLVHDAARPLAGPGLVKRVIDRLLVGDVDGVIPTVGVRDTIKQVDGEAVVNTVDRSSLAAVQTPQGFRSAALRNAHRAVTEDVTDDAQMIELLGGTVVTVEGSPRNLKVTYADDLIMAESLL